MDLPPNAAINVTAAALNSDTNANTNKLSGTQHTAGHAPKVIGIRSEDVEYVDRHAVRTITTNEKGEIIIIHVKKGDYYKLPGGGIEKNEDHLTAGGREVMEETGRKVYLDRHYFATTEEWRNGLHQISYCYIGRLVENTGAVELTEDETAEGLQHEWSELRAAIEEMYALTSGA